MKKLIFILAIVFASCSTPEGSEVKFCGNVTWAEYDPMTESANVTLNNGIETKVINVKPAKQYIKGEFVCL